MLGFAGLVLDNYWHTNFGLDETAWSMPHAMLGWSWFVAMLGFIACRLALRPYRPLRWVTAVALGWLVPKDAPQWRLNRNGLPVEINLNWTLPTPKPHDASPTAADVPPRTRPSAVTSQSRSAGVACNTS